MNPRDIVLSSYPQAVCNEIAGQTSSYFLIHDIGSMRQDLIGYSMVSENDAWEHAADVIGKRMLAQLESA